MARTWQWCRWQWSRKRIWWVAVPAGYVLYALPLVVWFIRNDMGHRELSIEWRSAKDRPEAK